jgi:hypothetical protein
LTAPSGNRMLTMSECSRRAKKSAVEPHLSA